VKDDGYVNALNHRPELGLPEPGDIKLGTWAELLDLCQNRDKSRSIEDDAGDPAP